eukprot:m.92943 g.92943  ORF g.92943 m.92943 type:complete len:309 (+) comp15080_c1_seq2:2019-2945(+)
MPRTQTQPVFPCFRWHWACRPCPCHRRRRRRPLAVGLARGLLVSLLLQRPGMTWSWRQGKCDTATAQAQQGNPAHPQPAMATLYRGRRSHQLGAKMRWRWWWWRLCWTTPCYRPLPAQAVPSQPPVAWLALRASARRCPAAAPMHPATPSRGSPALPAPTAPVADARGRPKQQLLPRPGVGVQQPRRRRPARRQQLSSTRHVVLQPPPPQTPGATTGASARPHSGHLHLSPHPTRELRVERACLVPNWPCSRVGVACAGSAARAITHAPSRPPCNTCVQPPREVKFRVLGAGGVGGCGCFVTAPMSIV